MSSGVSARKWHRFPAQAVTFFRSGRILRLIPAQNFICGQSARVRRAIPAQAATFFLSAQKKIPYFGAEWCHGAIQADLAAHSRAGNKKKLTQKVSFAVYFLKCMLFT